MVCLEKSTPGLGSTPFSKHTIFPVTGIIPPIILPDTPFASHDGSGRAAPFTQSYPCFNRRHITPHASASPPSPRPQYRNCVRHPSSPELGQALNAINMHSMCPEGTQHSINAIAKSIVCYQHVFNISICLPHVINMSRTCWEPRQYPNAFPTALESLKSQCIPHTQQPQTCSIHP